MLDLQFSVTSFGSQKAPRKVLLLHGLMGTGGVFFKVADKLVKDGYVSANTTCADAYPTARRLS
jgi:esterase/lipase